MDMLTTRIARKPIAEMTDAELRELPIFSGGDGAADAAAAKAASDKAAADAAAAAPKDATYWEKEAKKAFADRDTHKATAKENAAAAAELRTLKEAQMTELELATARVKELEPLDAEVKQHRETFTKLLAVEIEGMSDEHKALVPPLTSDAQKLSWIREAKAKGLFGTVRLPIGSRLPGGGGGTTITKKELSQLPLAKFEAANKDIKAGKLTLVDA